MAMPLDTLSFSPHDHASHGDDATTDLIGTVHSPDEVYLMKRFMAGQDRSQRTLFPESLEDDIAEDNPVRVVDVFVDGLDQAKQGFDGVQPEATGRPSYHPAVLLKLSIYGYLNRIQSSRRLERESQRNVELMWLLTRLMPDCKTIADFRKDQGSAIRRVCREFVLLCRRLNRSPRPSSPSTAASSRP